MFRVIIEEIMQDHSEDCPHTVKRYEQVVDMLDMPAVMDAVNRKPRKPRERKAKVEA